MKLTLGVKGMDPWYLVSIGLHFLPFVIAILAFHFRKKLAISARISLWSLVIVYSFIMYGALAMDFYLDYELQKYDLNGDGVFSDGEINKEQELAMSKVIGDTGRTFAPFTVLVFSIVLAGVVFVMSKLFFLAKKILK